MKKRITLVLGGAWLLFTPGAFFYGGLMAMIDGTCAHWSLGATQFVWFFSGLVYAICGIKSLNDYLNKKFASAFWFAIAPIPYAILQLLTEPILDSPIRDCGLYG